MALISFDNAIELSVSTYLDLNPKQRAGISFSRDDVTRWLTNFHTRLDFVEHLVTNVTKQGMRHDKLAILFYHDVRNKIYHELGALLPRPEHVEAAREAAVWVFSALFGIDADSILVAEAEGLRVETPTTSTLSQENDLVALYLDLKQEVADLRSLMARQGLGAATGEQIVEKIVGSGDAEAGKRLSEAWQKSDQVVRALTNPEALRPSALELDELSKLMRELKSRLAVPLRQHNEQLAEQAVRATMTAVERGQSAIGLIHQSAGTGLSTTVAVYVDLISRHSGFQQFSLVVVGDRRTLVEQLFERLRPTFAGGPRPVLRLGTEAFELLKHGNPPCVSVGTVQALSLALEEGASLKNTIVIAAGFDIFSHMVATRLRDQYLISFTSGLRSVLRSGLPMIGAYSLDQAIMDGSLVPAQIVVKTVPSVGAQSREDPEREHALEDALFAFQPCPRSPLTLRHVDLLARDIVSDHLGVRAQSRKALVIVSSVDIGFAFKNAIQHAAYELTKTQDSIVDVLTSQATYSYPAAGVISAFNSPESSVSMLVVVKMWVGIDLRIANRAYLTCRLGPTELRRLVEGMSVPRARAERSVIVDYAGNDFRM